MAVTNTWHGRRTTEGGEVAAVVRAHCDALPSANDWFLTYLRRPRDSQNDAQWQGRADAIPRSV